MVIIRLMEGIREKGRRVSVVVIKLRRLITQKTIILIDKVEIRANPGRQWLILLTQTSMGVQERKNVKVL